MKELPALDGLSHAQKDAPIGGLWQELQTLRSEVEKLRVLSRYPARITTVTTAVKPGRALPEILHQSQ